MDNISNVDNFDIISNLMEFPSKEIFYVVSIIQRKKDFSDDSLEFSERKNKEHFIRHYFVRSKEELFKLKDSIIETCQKNNARAYYGLDGKNIKKVLKEQMKAELDLLTHESDGSEITSYRNLYNSICRLKETSESSLRCVHIDADFKTPWIIESLENCLKEFPFKKVETVNGYHFVGKIRNSTNNINIQKLGEIIKTFRDNNHLTEKDLEIKMNSMTLLYKA